MKTRSQERTTRKNIKLRTKLFELMEIERQRRCVTDGGYVAEYRCYAEAVEEYLRKRGYDTAEEAPAPAAKPARSVRRSRSALAKAV